MEFDKARFKGTLKAKSKTYEEIARGIGMKRDTFSRRIGPNGIGFYIDEIHRLMEVVPLSMDEVKEIFFAKSN